jgi:menaquinone-dependent protoporphyrinogen oxidase
MPTKVLVAYASKAGSTEGVARAVAEALTAAGVDAEARAAAGVEDLTPYRAVVLGSAIRAGRPLPEATSFARRHAGELAHRPVALFVVCLNMCNEDEKKREESRAWLKPLEQIVTPVEVGLFAGSLDTKKLGCVLGTIFAVMSKIMGQSQGDFRDWEKIKEWAAAVARKVKE